MFTVMHEPRETFGVESTIEIKRFVNGSYFHPILSFIYTLAAKYMYLVLLSSDSY